MCKRKTDYLRHPRKNLFTITSSLDLVFGPAQFWLAFSIGMSNFLSTWPFIPLSLVVSGPYILVVWLQHTICPSWAQRTHGLCSITFSLLGAKIYITFWFLSHSYCHPFFHFFQSILNFQNAPRSTCSKPDGYRNKIVYSKVVVHIPLPGCIHMQGKSRRRWSEVNDATLLLTFWLYVRMKVICFRTLVAHG